MWPRAASALLGLWLMASPALLGLTGALGVDVLVVGPCVFAVAVIACWEVTRAVRWLNLIGGLWLMNAPWVLGGGPPAAILAHLATGLALVLLAPRSGPLRKARGGGWRALVRPND